MNLHLFNRPRRSFQDCWAAIAGARRGGNVPRESRAKPSLKLFCVRLVAVLLLGLGFHGTSHATQLCAATTGLPGPFAFTPTVAVSSSLQPGDTIPGTSRPFTIAGMCTLGKGTPSTIQVGSNIVACTLDSGSTEISPGIYTTTVSGVGMRLRDGAGNPVQHGSGQNCYSVIAQIGAGGSFSFSGTYELVRIAGTIPNGASLSGGPTGAGAWAFGVYNTNVVLNADNGNIYSGSSSIYPIGNITLKNIACNVTAPSVVRLPSVSTRSLAGGGAGSTLFQIGLNCDSNTVVGITVDAAPGINMIDASNGILDLQAGTGGATGIGVQVLDQNQRPLAMKVRNDFGSISANVTFDHSYYVRYIRTVGALNAGSVSSAMTFTMDYQ
ncbi:fimbrial protein [Dyella jiangningensis]|uniref:Fimbrial-type adhesion domain-containing protein n=1 Tax=Dyella jiangningensis TaxID=1379159 RepID=A0A328P7S8_9GAMM|nr:fimbrial protein [Dyella jiangningensis]RAO76882.1 hypothetical protein CA260_02920 [Dyella jiangningensis]